MQRALAGHPPPQDAVTRRVLQAALGRGSEARCDAVVVSGWLVRGDSWVESPPRAGYPLDDVVCVTARRNPEAQRKGPHRCCRAFLQVSPSGKSLQRLPQRLAIRAPKSRARIPARFRLVRTVVALHDVEKSVARPERVELG